MTTMIGRELAQEIKSQLAAKIKKLEVKPALVVIQVGKNTASNRYIAMKEKAAKEIGVNFELISFPTKTTKDELRAKLYDLNNDNTVSGVIVQLPLPKNIDVDFVLESILPSKDVDGLTPMNIGRLSKGAECLAPATAEGVINLLRYYGIQIKGVNAVVVGRSNLVGKPTAQMLLNEGATVTICHSKTKDLSKYTKTADIVVSAVGKPNLVTAKMVKRGAVVIDVGVSFIDGKVVGDVDFKNVSKVASLITPPAGGVGPMTVAMLLSNVVKTTEIDYWKVK